MVQKVLSFVERHHMIERGSHILAGVSGGADSVCLLLVLKEILSRYEGSLTVVHVEHGIRGADSRRDAVFVEQLCKRLGIACVTVSCDAPAFAKNHGMSLEEGARELRYGQFARVAKEVRADRIAVAHNQNDCAETLLFHLARGSGLKGMGGIAPVRDRIIRPLLGISRQEIEVYLEEQGQEYCTDATNLETAYSRNKIRHQVLPLLTEVNSSAVTHLYQSTEMLAEAAGLVEQLAWQAREQCWTNGVLGEALQKQPKLIQETVVHGLLEDYAGSRKDIQSIHVRQVLELFGRQTGKGIDLPYGLFARRTYGGIRLQKKNPLGENLRSAKTEESHTKEPCAVGGLGMGSCPVRCLRPGDRLVLEEYGMTIACRLQTKKGEFCQIPKKKYTKWFDYDKIKDTLLLRKRCQGDYLALDAEGHRQKLKKYLINEKVPGEVRDSILLLAEGNHVLWVIGYRISEAYKVTEETKRILEVQVDGGSIGE